MDEPRKSTIWSSTFIFIYGASSSSSPTATLPPLVQGYIGETNGSAVSDCKTEHLKGADGYQQSAGRVPSDALLYQTGPGCMSASPVGLVEGRLATSNFKYLPGIARVPLDM